MYRRPPDPESRRGSLAPAASPAEPLLLLRLMSSAEDSTGEDQASISAFTCP
jgi:hypothetical protein